jgi:hypothetical protein
VSSNVGAAEGAAHEILDLRVGARGCDLPAQILGDGIDALRLAVGDRIASGVMAIMLARTVVSAAMLSPVLIARTLASVIRLACAIAVPISSTSARSNFGSYCCARA